MPVEQTNSTYVYGWHMQHLCMYVYYKLNLVKQILFMYLKIPLVSRQCIQYCIYIIYRRGERIIQHFCRFQFCLEIEIQTHIFLNLFLHFSFYKIFGKSKLIKSNFFLLVETCTFSVFKWFLVCVVLHTS